MCISCLCKVLLLLEHLSKADDDDDDDDDDEDDYYFGGSAISTSNTDKKKGTRSYRPCHWLRLEMTHVIFIPFTGRTKSLGPS